MRWLLFALVIACAGCPYVPEGEIKAESGVVPVTPGAKVAFRLHCDYLFDGWERVGCGRDWQVQGVPGGNATFGTITDCGEYVAPIARPSEPIVISASECDWGGQCFDACGVGRTLSLEGYPAR